jgi:RNA 2',3'-cyclic 3'-phosphodiesterase
MAIRSFLAFELPEGIKNEVARIAIGAKNTGLDAGWVKPDNIHLTMVFMGDMEERDMPAIISCMDNALKNITPFEISLSSMGVFPDIRRPRVLWLGLNGDFAGLSALRDALQTPLAVFGVEQEKRAFAPHLTLARFRRPAKDAALLKKVIDKYSDISGPEERLDELVLFKSDLRQGGSVYTRIHAWPLA